MEIPQSSAMAMASASASASASPEDPEPILIPSLPNDVALNILARIPRSHHPVLSVVSRPFRSILSSPLFYATRSLLCASQPSLYVSLRLPNATSLRWFRLHQNPSAKASPFPSFLVPLPPTPCPLVGSAIAAVGPKIYVIGGSHNDIPSPRVWSLDCRFHTWEAVPSMRIPREFAAAGAVDGRIYVIGGCVVDTWVRSRNWAEVFDTGAGRWEPVESARDDMLREKWMHASAVIDGRVYAMADRNGVVYEPKVEKWGCVGTELDMGWRGRACVVDGVLYCYDYLGGIKGFDVEKGLWRELRDLERELPKFLCGATMADFGGRLMVVWEGKNGREVEVSCAEIAVEKKRGGEDLWGEVVWSDVVYKAPAGSSIVHCLAVKV